MILALVPVAIPSTLRKLSENLGDKPFFGPFAWTVVPFTFLDSLQEPFDNATIHDIMTTGIEL